MSELVGVSDTMRNGKVKHVLSYLMMLDGRSAVGDWWLHQSAGGTK